MPESGDHNVIGAHSHANLLCWVTMVLFGTFFARVTSETEGRLAMVRHSVILFTVIAFSRKQFVAGREATAES